jgi:hypothetical protein
MIRRAVLLIVVCLGLPALAHAQDSCLDNAQSFTQWINCRIDLVIAAKSGPSGGEKQAEAPSVAEDSTTLVDTSSAPDFLGFGVTLLRLRNAPAGSDDANPGGTSITATAYSLLAAAYGQDPLADPDFYAKHRTWRRVSFSLGREPAREDGAGLNGASTIAGVKVVLFDLREITRTENLTEIHSAVAAANVAFANVQNAVIEILASALAPGGGPAAGFAASSLGVATFRATLMKADADLLKRIDAAILARITAEVAMRDAIKAKITEIKNRPQISLAWASNLRDATAPNQHRFQAILDYNLAPRLSATGNLGLDLIDDKGLTLPPDTDTSVFRAAGSLKLAFADPGHGLVLSKPVTLGLSLDLQASGGDTTYKTQVKLDFPVTAGVTIPISLTWADRPEVIDEKEVRGLFGFTIDTSKLAALLR